MSEQAKNANLYNNHIDKISDVSEKVLVLYRKSAFVLKERFSELCNRIAASVMATPEGTKVEAHVAALKNMMRVVEKLCLRPEEGVPWDIVRAHIVVAKMQQVIEVLKFLKEEPGLLILAVSDKFSFPKDGWA